MGSVENRYDDEYPPLCANEVDLWTVESVSSTEKDSNMEKFERKMLSIPERSLPENINLFYQKATQDVKKYNATLVMSKMPSGSYNLSVRCPSSNMNNVIGIIRILIENKVTKDLVVEPHILSKLTLNSDKTIESIISLFDNRLTCTIQENVLQIYGVTQDVDEAVGMLNEKFDKIRSSEERILDEIDPKYFSLVRGPFDCNLKSVLSALSKPVSVVFPPAESDLREIKISGFTSDVQAVSSYLINKYHEFAEYQETTLPMALKYKDNITRVSGIDKILKQTGVAVYISADKSDKKIYLIGHEDDLAESIPVILARAKNYDVREIACQTWLYNILKNIPEFEVTNLKREHKELWFSYVPNKELIMLDGPSSVVINLDSRFNSKIAEIKTKFSFKLIQYPATFLTYLKARGLQNINEGVLEFNANVDLGEIVFLNKIIPFNSSLQMQLSGEKSKIDEAFKYVTTFLSDLKQNFSLEIEFESGFLPHIEEICLNNSIIDQIRAKCGSLVKIILKTPKSKRHFFLNLFGMKGTVLSAEIYFEEIVNNIKKVYAVKDINIPKVYHHLIIGKGGSTRTRIIEESGVERLFVPVAEYKGPDSCIISIFGKTEYVDIAESMIMEVCNIDVELDEFEVFIKKSLAYQLRLLDGLVLRKFILNATKNYKDIGGANDVSVVFTTEDEDYSTLKVRGPKQLVQIVSAALDNLSNSGLYTELVPVGESYFKSIIGRNGVTMQKLVGNLNAFLVIPSIKQNKGKNNDKIVVMGFSKDDMEKLRDNLFKFVQELKDINEVKLKIPSKFSKKFTMRQGDEDSLLQQYQNNYPSVKIIFPRDENNDEYIIRGPSAFVAKVHKDMSNQINFWEKMVTTSFTVTTQHLACARQQDKDIINTLSDTHKVVIRLKKEKDVTSEDLDEITNRFLATVEGLPNNVEAVKKIFQDYKPVQEEIQIHKKYHSAIIGAKGAGLKKLLDGLNVSLKFPRNDDISEILSMSGPASHLETFKKRLQPVLNDLTKRQNDWEQRNQIVELDIDPKWYSKLIGKGGSFISMFKKKYDVNIFIPGAGNITNVVLLDHKFVTIKGEINKINLAKKNLEELIIEWESTEEEVIQISKEYHARIRGTRSLNLKNLQRKHHVDIRFAPQVELENNSIFIRGRKEGIQSAINEINDLVSSFMQVAEEEEPMPAAERYTIDKFKFTKRDTQKNQNIQGNLDNYNNGLKTLQEVYGREKGTFSIPNGTTDLHEQEPSGTEHENELNY